MTHNYEDFLRFAHILADAGGMEAKRFFRKKVDIEHKQDKSPVTEADRRAEAAMRELIEAHYPDHGIWGEEFGKLRADAEYVWVLDPIDGTLSFITGKPIFGTLIALMQNSKPIIGIIDQPIIYDRWCGVDGIKTTLNEYSASTSGCKQISDARLSTTSPEFLPGEKLDIFNSIKKDVRTVVYGGDCYQYGLLASGHIDIVMEAGLNPYDFCALLPVLKGAGAVVTDWQGNEVNVHEKGDIIASASNELHQQILGRVVS